MKQLRLLFACLILSLICQAQKKAVTDEGEEVILYNDGTWKYSKAPDSVGEIKTNPNKVYKNINASFLLKSTKCEGIGVWLDPKKWQFGKSKNNPSAEFEIQLKGQDLYAMMISEKIEIPLESLKDIALSNAKEVAPDIVVAGEEYRTVNNLKVLFIQMNGTMKGMKVTYYGYYYSHAGGTVQFITYTAQNLLKNYTKDAEELLSGLSKVK
ncbi:MAG: hypothetical protein ABIN67_16265 [Ferruginibacter sp.]